MSLAGSACGSVGSCPAFSCYSGDGSVGFELSCIATDLQGVELSGACAASAQPSWSYDDGRVVVYGHSPGACHVELRFASGFEYSADTTFAETYAPATNCCPATTVVSATPALFVVNNPGTTCVDSGIDSGSDGSALLFYPDAAPH